jgi:hypothetical protein
MKWFQSVALICGIVFSTACEGGSATEPRHSWSDYAGAWLMIPNTSSPNYRNCNNVRSTGVHVRFNADAMFEVVTGQHDAGYTANDFRGSLTGSLTPPNSGALRFVRPGGEGRLAVTSVTPTRIEGAFRSTDQSFADPSFGRTPCEFTAVLQKQ